jgi:hypothetical protein
MSLTGGGAVSQTQSGFFANVFYISPWELGEWMKHYIPPPSVSKDALIVDVGARDADSAIFYAICGYHNLRLVEPNPIYHKSLQNNVAKLTTMGVKIDLHLHPFNPACCLQGAAFVKFDCEGCEAEAHLDTLTIPWVAEMHNTPKKNAQGIYEYSGTSGYRKGGT